MAETKRSYIRSQLAKALRDQVEAHETAVRDMRARELAPKEGRLAKHELCPLCGGADRNGVCKCLVKNATEGYGGDGSDGGGMAMGEKGLSKKTPPDVSEKTMHKLKDEYGHDEKGKSKAYATAWAIENKTVKKDEPGMAKASSSAAALAPAAPRPATPAGQANKELGGFKSLASAPAHMPAAGGPSLVPGAGRKPISSMGRASASAAGVIPQAKSEKNPGSARSPYGTGGAGHAGQGNMPSALKERMAPVAKDEKSIAPVNAVPEKALPGTKMPKKGTSEDAEKQGSGGETSKEKALSKGALPAVKGVGGKQPVGQGGGDAGKPFGSTLPKPSVGPGTKPVAPGSVDVDVSDFNMDSKKNVAAGNLRRAGSAEVGRLIADKGAAGNPNVAPTWRSGPPIAAGNPHLRQAAAPAVTGARQAAGQLNVNPASDLAADKRAGGVGFLNALVQKFRPAPPINRDVNPDGSAKGPITSQRFHGALPLQRAEKPMKKGALSYTALGKCAMCKSDEHPGLCKGLSGWNHSRNMMSVGSGSRRRMAVTRKRKT